MYRVSQFVATPRPQRRLKKVTRVAWSCAQLGPPNLGSRQSVAVYGSANCNDGALYLGRRLFLNDADVPLFAETSQCLLAPLPGVSEGTW
ncbi:hypothetical protein CGRA01v4_06005 [Colletotrichum graminicola]|nr:hypothetical protein CGRA01v4_06005 [Colletotrichum graminicola]